MYMYASERPSSCDVIWLRTKYHFYTSPLSQQNCFEDSSVIIEMIQYVSSLSSAFRAFLGADLELSSHFRLTLADLIQLTLRSQLPQHSVTNTPVPFSDARKCIINDRGIEEFVGVDIKLPLRANHSHLAAGHICDIWLV